jgi:hypothetical protein
MKKVKFMLMSFALIAFVSGALAFKAKFDLIFCITNAISHNREYTCKDAQGVLLTCPNSFEGKVDLNHAVGDVPYCTAIFDEDLGGVGNQSLSIPVSLKAQW